MVGHMYEYQRAMQEALSAVELQLPREGFVAQVHRTTGSVTFAEQRMRYEYETDDRAEDVTSLLRRVIVCKFATGAHKDSPVFIPRIDCYHSIRSLPFRLRRRQFLIKLSFCMTINKCHGQSFTRVGIELSDPLFTHGRLYVALSRARSRDGIFISARNDRMQNIVYGEVLR